MATVLSLFAVTPPGLEPLAAKELRALGADAAPEPGGVAFSGEQALLFDANLHLRTATRVLVRIASFRATEFWELEKRAQRIPWYNYLRPGAAVALRVSSGRSRLYHEGAIAERLLRIITERTGAAPTEDVEELPAGSQLFVVRVDRDQVVVSADASGAPLHHRGYRRAAGKAPLRETLAAGMLMAAGWRLDAPLLDPFCGAGTIPLEAALMTLAVPPGLATAGRQPRAYAFQDWPWPDAAVFEKAVDRARGSIREGPLPAIRGRDRDAGAVAAARANADRAGLGEAVSFEEGALSTLEAATAAPAGGALADRGGSAGAVSGDPALGPPGWLVTNPPYGKRVGESGPLRDLYAALGRMARERLAGWRVALLSADPRLEAQVGLRLREALQTSNGGIPVRVVVADVPEGGGGPP